MPLTKKHYELITKTLHNVQPSTVGEKYEQWEVVCTQLCEALNPTNASFDEERFMNACYGV